MIDDPHDPLPHCDCHECSIVERNRLRKLLQAVVDELEDDPDQAPGHCHETPGVWDDDHRPGIAGTPCTWCATWKLVREAVK